MKVQFYENNSGGYRRLTSEHWFKLAQNGWQASIPYATKDFPATTFSRAREQAIQDWESITGLDSEDEGCECCGRPFEFREDWD